MNLAVVKETPSRAAPSNRMPGQGVICDLRALLGSEELADVRFNVGITDKKIFPAHRFLLAARSPVFKSMLFGENFMLSIH